MTRRKNVMRDGNESQATSEAMLRKHLQQSVRTALISVLEEEVEAFIGALSGDKIIAMCTIAEAWIPVLGTSWICRYHAHEEAIRRSSLSALIAAARI